VSDSIDIAAAIDARPWGGRQKLILVMVGAAIMFDGFDNQSLGLAAPAIIHGWGISKALLAPVLAMGQFGMMLGTALGGMLGDRLGRKTVLVASAVLFGLATLAMAASQGLAMLGALRLLSGIGLGGALPNAAALVSEYTPARRRSLAVTAGVVCVPLGGVLGGLVAAWLLPREGWRVLFALAGVLTLAVAAVLVAALPESARFLFRRHGDGPRLRQALARIGLAAPAGTALHDGMSGTPPHGSLGQLFAPGYLFDTIAFWLAFAFCLLAIYAGFNWLPTMLSDAGYGLSLASTGLTAFNLGGVITALAAARAIDRFGSRAPMVWLSFAGAGVAALLILFPLGPAMPLWLAIAALAVLGGCANGVQTTLYALGAHLYPVHARASGVGFGSGVGRIGAISSAFVGAIVLSWLGPAGFYALMIVAMALTGLALVVLRNHSRPHLSLKDMP
jgi:MFS transporter, AAHS family, 4-hydroxybenzoate transporter